MDARLAVEDLFGLQTGEAHIIRNAGGVVAEDTIRSLVISHHLLDTRPTTGSDAVTVRGFIYDVDTALLSEVAYPGAIG